MELLAAAPRRAGGGKGVIYNSEKNENFELKKNILTCQNLGLLMA